MPVLYNLQALRAIAAAMVVLYHARTPLEEIVPALAHLHAGAAGVDIFFVLSGVVIALSGYGKPVHAGHFARQRLLRVVPLYWLALALVGLMLVLGLSPVGVTAGDATVGNMLRSMFFVPFAREHGVLMPLLGVGWTLNYEVFFYMLFALTLLLAPHRREVALVGGIAGLVAIGLALRPETGLATFYTNPLLLEFAAGVGLARWWRERGDGPGHAPTGLLLLTAGLAWLVLAARPESFTAMTTERIFLFGIPAILIVAGALQLEAAGHRLRGAFWQLAGAASYAVYLFHTIILQIVAKLGAAIGLAETSVGLIAVTLTAIVAAQLGGIALHLYLERPLTAWLRGGRPAWMPQPQYTSSP